MLWSSVDVDNTSHNINHNHTTTNNNDNFITNDAIVDWNDETSSFFSLETWGIRALSGRLNWVVFNNIYWVV